MTIVSIVLALLKLAGILADYARTKQAMDAGEDKAIAQASASILAKSAAAKEVWEEVSKMTDKQVDDGLKGLEP